MTKLKDFIKELEVAEKTIDVALQKKSDKLVARIIAEIGKTTSYDTGYARKLIAEVLADVGSTEMIDELNHRVYNYWNTMQKREFDGGSSHVVKVANNNGLNRYVISINDEGFANQQEGIVSSTHPRQDASVIPNNVNFVLDTLETGTNPEIEREIKELRNIVIDVLMKGRLL